MQEKKILIDARCVGGEGQGMLTYIVGLYQAMHKQYNYHYDFYFAGYDYDEMKASFPWLESTHFIHLDTQSKWSLFTKVFPNIIKNYQIDFAHFQYVTPFIKKCKQIVTTHDVLFLDFPEEFSRSYRIKRKLLFYFSLLRSEIRLTVSNYSREKIAEHFQLSTDSISITPNAVKASFLEPFDKTKAKQSVLQKLGISNYILYVSRIEKRKNQLELLQSYLDLRLYEKGFELVLVGNNTLGDQEIADKIKAAQSQYPGKIHWLTNISDADLIEVYQAAKLFVYPSKAEGFGIPPIEAAVLGVNTLCANNTAMQDFDFFKENLYDASDPAELTQLLYKNICHPPSTDRLERIAHEVREEYSWQTAAEVLHSEIIKS